MKPLEFRGEITVFLSLIFVLVLSLVGGMIQSTSIHINKSMKRADTSLAVESVFAEYNKEMLKKYDIFARVIRDEGEIAQRLSFYGSKGVTHRIQKMRLLTDCSGQPFFEQAIKTMGGETVQIQESPKESYRQEEEQITNELEELLRSEEQELPSENDPLELIGRLKKESLLKLVLPQTEELSERYVKLEELPSFRDLKKGTGDYGASSKGGVANKMLFATYLTKHFSNYGDEAGTDSLFYEIEYLLCGCATDRENLEAVAKKLLTIRVAFNYAYLLTDQTKQAEAEALALGLCSLLTLPQATQVVKQAILFAWAYGEGIGDLKVLFKGEGVSLIKTSETWRLSLSNLWDLEISEGMEEESGQSQGFGYEDYLGILLLEEDTDSLCMRALDMMELNLGVRMDGCVTALEIKTTYQMQRGIRDIFLTDFQYK